MSLKNEPSDAPNMVLEKLERETETERQTETETQRETHTEKAGDMQIGRSDYMFYKPKH